MDDNDKTVLVREIQRYPFYVWSEEIHPACPSCGEGKMQPWGRRRRLVIFSDGQKLYFFIRRLRCPRCLRIHHELPDFIIPRKHFAAVCLLKAVRKEESALFCENSTINRWRRWFLQLCEANSISSLSHYPEAWLPQLVLTLF